MEKILNLKIYLKKIFGSGTGKKVENFLRETQPSEMMAGDSRLFRVPEQEVIEKIK